MVSRHPRAWSLVALTMATLLVLLGALVAQVGRPYPGFFMAPDFRVFPSSPAAVAPEWGDRIVSVDGRSPVTLEKRLASDGPPIRYEIERAGRRVALDLAPQPFPWPKPPTGTCRGGSSGWGERHRVIPRLYTGALVAGSLTFVSFVALSTVTLGLLVDGWIYPASVATLFTLAAVSFPIKIAALLDTRRRAASPLVNQQTTVLLFGIGRRAPRAPVQAAMSGT